MAISEMQRTGIPASIKLAQGILGSDARKSKLALQSNNHFGIKCGGSWSGQKAFRKDDDYRNGRLIKSCFRKYDSPEHSYIAHTDFLSNQPRYAFLFQIEPTNYRKWAKGLKKAGYASDPKYASRLISIIESYQLNQYDKKHGSKTKPLIFEGEVELIDYDKSLQFINDVKSIYLEEPTSVERIASQHDLSPRRLLKYNEHFKSEKQTILEGELVYLQPKRRSFRGRKNEHIVKEGENMYFISQKYGVKLKQLYKRNNMVEGSQPAPGSRIVLRGKVKSGKAPQLVMSNVNPEPIQMPNETEETIKVTSNAVLDSEKASQSILRPQILYYTVKSGDTLYGLSRKFNVSIDELKQVNRIENDMIKVGQKLQVSL